jgi:hypothetical protein
VITEMGEYNLDYNRQYEQNNSRNLVFGKSFRINMPKYQFPHHISDLNGQSEVRRCHGIKTRIMRERDHLEDPGVEGRKILR